METAIYSLYLNVSNLWRSVLCGSQNETQRLLYDFMKDIQIGNFVMENSSGWMATRAWEEGRKEDAVNHIKAMFGTLEEIAREPITGLEEGDEVIVETVYYIKNLHGVRFRWHNASFLSVPKEFNDAR